MLEGLGGVCTPAQYTPDDHEGVSGCRGHLSRDAIGGEEVGQLGPPPYVLQL